MMMMMLTNAAASCPSPCLSSKNDGCFPLFQPQTPPHTRQGGLVPGLGTRVVCVVCVRPSQPATNVLSFNRGILSPPLAFRRSPCSGFRNSVSRHHPNQRVRPVSPSAPITPLPLHNSQNISTTSSPSYGRDLSSHASSGRYTYTCRSTLFPSTVSSTASLRR